MRGQRRVAQWLPPFFDQLFIESKGKEVAGVQDLLSSMPDLPGCVLTLDALHNVKQTFEKVVDKQADFLVCVKDNAADLRRRIEKHLDKRGDTLLRAETEDKAHGRLERRELEMAPLLPWQTDWPHTHVACRVTRERRQLRRGEIVRQSKEHFYYVGSFAADRYSPEHVLSLIRGHWSIENCLHHRKDRSMDEDRCRATAGKTGRIMCCLRSISAMVFGRAAESLSIVQRRLSRKIHLLLGLFSSTSLTEWESHRSHRGQSHRVASGSNFSFGSFVCTVASGSNFSFGSFVCTY